jgi:hypothetical protein
VVTSGNIKTSRENIFKTQKLTEQIDGGVGARIKETRPQIAFVLNIKILEPCNKISIKHIKRECNTLHLFKVLNSN